MTIVDELLVVDVGVVRNLVDGKLSYRDFVWFLISEEDKRHPRRFCHSVPLTLFIAVWLRAMTAVCYS